MSRLIDADLLKSDFNDVVPFDIVELPGIKIDLYRNSIIQQVIDEQPTVDAVEVVRCKNCEHYDKNVTIDETLSYCDMQECYEEPNDYCCYGIKKGGAK